MKKFKLVKNTITASAFLLIASISTVNAQGVDEGALKGLIDSFLKPILNGLLYAVPIATAIAIVINILKNFFMSEQEKDEFNLIGKCIKLAIIGGIATGVLGFLKIFGVY